MYISCDFSTLAPLARFDNTDMSRGRQGGLAADLT